jgi:hypothetical protein
MVTGQCLAFLYEAAGKGRLAFQSDWALLSQVWELIAQIVANLEVLFMITKAGTHEK